MLEIEYNTYIASAVQILEEYGYQAILTEVGGIHGRMKLQSNNACEVNLQYFVDITKQGRFKVTTTDIIYSPLFRHNGELTKRHIKTYECLPETMTSLLSAILLTSSHCFNEI